MHITHTHTHMYTYTYIIHAHTHVHKCTHTHTHIHACIHTYIHTHAHTHTQILLFSNVNVHRRIFLRKRTSKDCFISRIHYDFLEIFIHIVSSWEYEDECGYLVQGQQLCFNPSNAETTSVQPKGCKDL